MPAPTPSDLNKVKARVTASLMALSHSGAAFTVTIEDSVDLDAWTEPELFTLRCKLRIERAGEGGG